MWALSIELAATLVATYVIAFVSYVLVEHPAIKAAKSLEPLLFGSTDCSSVDNSKAKLM